MRPLVLLALLFSQSVFAQNCILTPNDAYDPGAAMPFGKYKGQCIDTSVKRPVVLLAEDEHHIVFANLRDQGAWWIADVPKDAVARVILDAKDLEIPLPFLHAAHIEMRFILKPGRVIRLTAQDPSAKIQQSTLTDVMWSMEYAAPKGVPYNPALGSKQRYTSVDRLVSTEDRGREQMASTTYPVYQWELNIPSQEDRDNLLWNGIRDSAKNGFDVAYDSFTSSCETSFFALLDQTLRYNGANSASIKPFELTKGDLFEKSTTPVLAATQARGLTNSSSGLPTLNEETGNGKNF